MMPHVMLYIYGMRVIHTCPHAHVHVHAHARVHMHMCTCPLAHDGPTRWQESCRGEEGGAMSHVPVQKLMLRRKCLEGFSTWERPASAPVSGASTTLQTLKRSCNLYFRFPAASFICTACATTACICTACASTVFVVQLVPVPLLFAQLGPVPLALVQLGPVPLVQICPCAVRVCISRCGVSTCSGAAPLQLSSLSRRPYSCPR